MAATSDPAFAVFIFAQGEVDTINGLPFPFVEFMPASASGLNALNLASFHGPEAASIATFGNRGLFGVQAEATAFANDDFRGSSAFAEVSLTVTDRVTPTLSPGFAAQTI